MTGELLKHLDIGITVQCGQHSRTFYHRIQVHPDAVLTYVKGATKTIMRDGVWDEWTNPVCPKFYTPNQIVTIEPYGLTPF